MISQKIQKALQGSSAIRQNGKADRRNERRGNRRAAPGNYDEFDRSDVKADRRKTA